MPLLDIAGAVLTGAALSPGGRWIAFVPVRPDGMAVQYVAPVGKRQAPRDAWMQIAEDRNYLGSPTWSPDAKPGRYGYSFSTDSQESLASKDF